MRMPSWKKTGTGRNSSSTESQCWVRRDTVTRQVQAALARLLGGDHIVGRDSPADEVPEHVRDVGEPSQPLEQAQRLLAFFPGILEDAGDAGRLPGQLELFALGRVTDAARHGHVLGQVLQLALGGPFLDGLGQGRSIDRRLGGEGVAVEDQRLAVQGDAVLQVLRLRLENVERGLAAALDCFVGRDTVGGLALRFLGCVRTGGKPRQQPSPGSSVLQELTTEPGRGCFLRLHERLVQGWRTQVGQTVNRDCISLPAW
jgi:hypothetical protein